MHRMGAQVHRLGANEPTCTPPGDTTAYERLEQFSLFALGGAGLRDYTRSEIFLIFEISDLNIINDTFEN